MNRSSVQRTLAAWATRPLLVAALSALVAVHATAAVAQEQSASPMPTSIPTPAVSDSTRAATAAALTVTGLRADQDAVVNGLSLPWSSGAVEGHVNRIKMLKRQMYGRANPDLLRRRVLLAD